MYTIQPATTTDEAALRALCSVPMRGSISLAFERNPDFFAGAAVQCNRPELYVCREEGKESISGMFGVGMREVWKDGQKTGVRYFSDMRIAASASGSRLFFEIGKFVMAHNFCETQAQTIVFSDNAPMIRIIENSAGRSRRLHLPYYHPAGRYVSCLLPFAGKTKPSKNRLVRRAGASDLPQMQVFHNENAPGRPFYPVMDFAELDHNGFYNHLKPEDFWLIFEKDSLMGMAAVWDQKPFKQTRIVAYQPFLRATRPVLNRLAPVLGTIPLPPAGAAMPYLNLSAVLIRNQDPEIFHDLTAHILQAYKGFGSAYLLAGAMETDPLAAVFQRFSNKRTVWGNFYWVSRAETPQAYFGDPLVYFDVARI